MPIVGYTWYSLIDQVDWDVALRENRGTVNPLGLFDLQRNIRAVGTAYRDLIRDWCEVLPTQSICLRVPIVLPLDDECAAAGVAAPRPDIGQPSSQATAAPTNTE